MWVYYILFVYFAIGVILGQLMIIKFLKLNRHIPIYVYVAVFVGSLFTWPIVFTTCNKLLETYEDI